MPPITYAHLKSGVIFGDVVNDEYIYMPASELGSKVPLCVFEKGSEREDLSLDAAVQKIERLSLRPVVHPRLGKNSCE